jgi:hypothetical protein
VNVDRAGHFSVFDKCHKIGHHFADVVITNNEPTLKQKRILHQKGDKRPLVGVNSLEQDLNRCWLIVRYMKSCYGPDPSLANRFSLRGGERIKVGRIIFTVKEI